jgi:hypothetical protein
MANIRLFLFREPAVVALLVSMILPSLVLLNVINIDTTALAALVVALNTAVAFAMRLVTSPMPAESFEEGTGPARRAE